MSCTTLRMLCSRSSSHSKGQMHTHVSLITCKLLKQIYEKACSVNNLDCFFLCQGYYRWSASRGEGPWGAFVTHCNISCFFFFFFVFYFWIWILCQFVKKENSQEKVKKKKKLKISICQKYIDGKKKKKKKTFFFLSDLQLAEATYWFQ